MSKVEFGVKIILLLKSLAKKISKCHQYQSLLNFSKIFKTQIFRKWITTSIFFCALSENVKVCCLNFNLPQKN